MCPKWRLYMSNATYFLGDRPNTIRHLRLFDRDLGNTHCSSNANSGTGAFRYARRRTILSINDINTRDSPRVTIEIAETEVRAPTRLLDVSRDTDQPASLLKPPPRQMALLRLRTSIAQRRLYSTPRAACNKLQRVAGAACSGNVRSSNAVGGVRGWHNEVQSTARSSM